MEGKDNKIESNNLINLQGKLIDLSSPKVMGIVNVNSDSFYAGSRANQKEQVLKKVAEHLEGGATFIDVGGISTRPGADLYNVDEELKRVIPAIRWIHESFPEALISVDTFRSEVARRAVNAGAVLINDVYGGRYDESMFKTVADLKVPYILMHSRGFSEDMMRKTDYENITKDVICELSESLSSLRKEGVKDVIIDPGFGFAKKLDDNYTLLHDLNMLKVLGCPVLVGISRKSMIYKKLGVNPEKSLNGTTVLNTLAIDRGAGILRVHDVKPAQEVINLLK